MRKFVDLHLRPSLEDHEQVKKMIDKSAELGFQMIGLSFSPRIDIGRVNQLRKVCHDAGVELITRIDLEPKGRHELLNNLRKLRRRFEIMSVFCASKVVARQAAKDRRVDLLSFSIAKHPRILFDRAEAELTSKASACLEIDLQPLLSLQRYARIRLLSVLRREIAMARSLKVPVVLSSGATNMWFLRKPQDLASLGLLFGLDFPLALNALSDIPSRIVERNKLKLSSDHVASGIRIVRGRDSCLSG